ncbi:MAG TPA: FHA domain-containing protein [Polyangiaceae bacterium]|nr:FHA domain-containing protein [Polyangiaceae bacterium]
MALTVVIRSGELKSPATITFDAPRIVIGRGDGCEVRLPDPSVSHRHASIRQRGTDYVVIDEGSTNGTFVGPVRLSPQAPRVVRSGDLVRIGRIWLELKIEQALPTNNPQLTTREIALSLVASALSAQGETAAATVRIEQGDGSGKELALSDFERVYVVGRAPNADLVLGDEDASRRHVELLRRGQHVCVRDLGSKNGSELGGERLAPNKETPWPLAARLRIGETELSLSDPIAQALGELETAADERMRPDDHVAPPESEPAASAEEKPLAGPDSLRGGAPIAELPRARESLPASASKHGFRTADALVALIALVVLGLSVLGIVWLLK